MERISSLIHSLKDKCEAGAHTSELLSLVDELRNELTRSKPAMDNVSTPISVWLPSGYNHAPMPPKEPLVKEITTPVMENPVAAIPAKPISSFEDFPAIEKITKVEEKQTTNGNQVNGGNHNGHSAEVKTPAEMPPVVPVVEPKPIFSVPRPPQVLTHEPEPQKEVVETPIAKVEPIVEKKIEAPVENKINVEPKPGPTSPRVENENSAHASHLPIFDDFLNGLPTAPLPQQQPGPKTSAPEPVAEKPANVSDPVLLELSLPGDIFSIKKPEPFLPNPSIPEGFLPIGTHVDVETETKPKELHEMLANRVLAQPRQQEAIPARMLVDALGGGKITDLKRGIGINDRFRFIKSLFRGDETLFDRSVKTINNFNVMQEAQYWMQRELVIKLAWNEEDELVQEFYNLVRRRFL